MIVLIAMSRDHGHSGAELATGIAQLARVDSGHGRAIRLGASTRDAVKAGWVAKEQTAAGRTSRRAVIGVCRIERWWLRWALPNAPVVTALAARFDFRSRWNGTAALQYPLTMVCSLPN